MLGPDLVDVRTLELTAERTAAGLVEAREATLDKPALIPAPQAGRRRRRRGRRALRQRPGGRRQRRARQEEAGRQEEGQGRRGPPEPRLARRRGAEGAGRPPRTPSSAPGRPTVVRAALLVPAERLLDVAAYLRDRNPIRYDYLASLQSVHYEDCIEVTYQLDSTEDPGSLIELRVRTDEAEGAGEVPSVVAIWPGADFQEREVFDMMGVRFAGHPNLSRILMWEGFAYYPLRKDYLEPYYEGPAKVFPSRVEEGHGQHLRAEEFNPYGTRT